MKNENHTLALIKPDAFRRQLVGAVLTRIEQAPFDIVSLQIFRAPRRQTWQFFYGRQHAGQPYIEHLVDFMCQGPVLALVLRRTYGDAVPVWRQVMGPWQAELRAQQEHRHTIRGSYMEGENTLENLVHGSDSQPAFLHEAHALGWSPGMWV